MKKLTRVFMSILIGFSLLMPKVAKADLFGGDVAVLTQILVQTIKQLYELRQIYQNGSDSLSLMRDINRGIRIGLGIVRVINPRFNPGLYGSLETAESVQRAIEELYGVIPQTSEYRLQEAQDRAVSESISMNGTLFEYADDVDAEAKRIISHAQGVNPQGAAKLTAESLAILIGVTTQVLRTNSMMLKMMGQNMALSNRKEKLQSSQFKNQYEGISNAFGKLPKKVHLKALGEH
jgi:hypothetical protein